MLCDRCKKEEACLHIRGIDQDGNVRSLNLCARCAIEEISKNGGEIDDRFLEAVRQATQDMGPEIMNLLQKNIRSNEENDEKNQSCSCCGKRRREFQEDYSLGCRECFRTFLKNIQHQLEVQFDYASLLPGTGQDNERPADRSGHPDMAFLEENIQRLRREMDLAVRREEYEQAAVLQEKIRSMQDHLLPGLEEVRKNGVNDGRNGADGNSGEGICVSQRLPWLPRRRQKSPVVVLSSFVTAERNLENLEIPPFVNRFDDAAETRNQLLTALKAENAMGRMNFYDPDKMERDGLTSLYEHGWCSPDFLLKSIPRGMAVSENERMVCLLNNRNHFELTYWGEAGQFSEMLPTVQQMLAGLSTRVTFWKCSSGYVTRDVRYIGTGIRMGGFLHLPALAISGGIRPVINACRTLGVTLLPCYPEKDGKNSLFVFFNSSSRNAPMEEIASQVRKVQDMLVRHELECRAGIQVNPGMRLRLCDLVGRAWGIIGTARILAPDEGRRLLSLIWLGMDYGMLPQVTLEKILQGICDISFYDMGALKKKLLPDGVSVEKILAARFRHDIAGKPAGE